MSLSMFLKFFFNFGRFEPCDSYKLYSYKKESVYRQRRATKGYYNNIVKELRFEDMQGLSDMFRMNYSTFQEVLMYIEYEITPNEVMGGHMVIIPGERLTLTLRFLATGETLLLDWLHKRFQHSEMLDPTCWNRLL